MPTGMATVLIPIPDMDFDPTEVAVSWQVLTGHGHDVVFATESGRPGAADDIMVSGRGLDFWSRVPGLGKVAVVGRFLRANRDARAAYADMQPIPNPPETHHGGHHGHGHHGRHHHMMGHHHHHHHGGHGHH